MFRPDFCSSVGVISEKNCVGGGGGFEKFSRRWGGGFENFARPWGGGMHGGFREINCALISDIQFACDTICERMRRVFGEKKPQVR